MDIKSVDSGLGLVEVKIENSREDIHADDEYRGSIDIYIDGEWLSLEQRVEKNSYPFEQVISTNGLARVAGRAMLAGKPEDFELARKIVDFFEAYQHSGLART